MNIERAWIWRKEIKCQTVVVPLLTAMERKTLRYYKKDQETPVQTDALLYVSRTLLMVGILEEVCPLHLIFLTQSLQLSPTYYLILLNSVDFTWSSKLRNNKLRCTAHVQDFRQFKEILSPSDQCCFKFFFFFTILTHSTANSYHVRCRLRKRKNSGEVCYRYIVLGEFMISKDQNKKMTQIKCLQWWYPLITAKEVTSLFTEYQSNHQSHQFVERLCYKLSTWAVTGLKETGLQPAQEDLPRACHVYTFVPWQCFSMQRYWLVDTLG